MATTDPYADLQAAYETAVHAPRLTHRDVRASTDPPVPDTKAKRRRSNTKASTIAVQPAVSSATKRGMPRLLPTSTGPAQSLIELLDRTVAQGSAELAAHAGAIRERISTAQHTPTSFLDTMVNNARSTTLVATGGEVGINDYGVKGRRQYAAERRRLLDLYVIVLNNADIRTATFHLRNEIFRRGLELIPAFDYICRSCGRTFSKEEARQTDGECSDCTYEDQDEFGRPHEAHETLDTPDPDQVRRFEQLAMKCNYFNQNLESILRETQDDISTVDDAFLYFRYEYSIDEATYIAAQHDPFNPDYEPERRLKQVFRLDPTLVEFDLDARGIPGMAHHACFTKGTNVLTNSGFKPIDELTLHDCVISHKGNVQPILKVMQRPYQGRMVAIETWGGIPVEATVDHPFLVTGKEDVRLVAYPEGVSWRGMNWRHGGRNRVDPTSLRPNWMAAGQIAPGDLIWTPIPQAEGVPVTYLENHWKSNHVRRTHFDGLPINDETLRLIGLWLAEGTTHGAGAQMGSGIGFTFCDDEIDTLARDASDLSKQYLDAQPVTNPVGNKHAINVRMHSVELSRFFGNYFGAHSWNRRIPQELMDAPNLDLIPLFKAFAEGDGCIDTKTNSVTVATTSKQLAQQLQVIALRAGVLAGMRSRTQRAGWRRLYEIVVQGENARRLRDLCGWSNNGPTNGLTSFGVIGNGYAAFSVRSVDEYDFSGPVYNLEVEEDHSFVVEGPMAVHNCPFDRDLLLDVPFDEGWDVNWQGRCERCGMRTYPVYFKYSEQQAGSFGARRPEVLYLFEDEVIHWSFYSPTETYGFSPVLSFYEKALTLIGMDRYLYDYFYERRVPQGVVAVYTDDIDSMRREQANVEAKMQRDPHYVPWIAVSSKSNQGKIEYIRFGYSLDELDYLPVRDEIRERISAVYGVSNIWMSDSSGVGGLNQESQQLVVMSRAVEGAQRSYHTLVFPKLEKALRITDWHLRLNTPEESSELTEVQIRQAKATVATTMHEIGFGVEYDPDTDEFTFSGSIPSQSDQAQQQQSVAGQNPFADQ